MTGPSLDGINITTTLKRKQVAICKACGDFVEHVAVRTEHLKSRGEEISAGEMCYCLECANELFRGRIAGPKTKKPKGPQTPRVGDPSPYRENAIRAMEER